MPSVLVDTDVFVDHLRGRQEFRPGRDRVFYSVITRAELFAGRASQDQVVQKLLAPFREISVDREIAEKAGRIRRTTEIGLADALIAASAQVRNLAVVTRNPRHFERVPSLRVRAP